MTRRPNAFMWKSLFSLDFNGRRPLQFQIRSQIVDAILDGTLRAGTSLPSSRKLAEELKVSRNTVILSYQQLVDDGFLVSRERSGFIVAQQAAAAPVGKVERPEPGSRIDWSARIGSKVTGQRNIEKPTNWQAYRYPFTYGQFDPKTFPIAAWRDCCRRAMGILDLQDWGRDTIDEDDPVLVEQILSRILPRRGIWADASQILITIGTQQALFLIAEALFRPGTVVGVEDPGYPDMRNIAELKGAAVRPLPVDAAGLVADAGVPGCDYVHVTPSHQCPTTVTMPDDRRKALLSLIETGKTILIEDDYESETRFEGSPLPALKSLDAGGRVIYVSSMSKTLAPGLRLGFIVADAQLIDELRALRRLMVRHPPLNNQRAIGLFLSLGHYEPMVARMAEVYQTRSRLIVEALRQHVPDARMAIPDGGSSIWLEGPQGFCARRASEEWRDKGLLFEPGDVFFASRNRGARFLRLGYSVIPEEAIEPGIRMLAQAMGQQVA